MADEIIRMENIYADDIVGNINEVREARGTFESLDARLDNIGGGNAPSPSTSDPAMDGTASPGSADTYSRGDHVHPTDMSRQAVIDSSHKLSSDLVDDTNNTNKFATAAQLQQITTNETNISSILDGTTIDSFGDVETALADKVDKETGKGLSTNDYTTAEKTKLAGIAEGAEVNVQSNWTQTTTTADDYIKNKPTLGTAAAKNATDAYNATGTDVTTGKAVAAALATLPEPMVFKGSLGTGGTITTLPTASSTNKGYVYKVITAGTYASQSAKVGDTFISDGSAWVLIPSGDEPSGTVTNVAVANGGGLAVSGSPIASSGTITIGHSNSVTAKTSSSLKKFTYDAYGHVTGSSELSTAESNALASGIDSTKVEQIETNKNNILYNTNTGVKNVYDYANSALAYKASSCIATKSTNGISVSSSGTRAFASYPMTLKSGTYKLVCTVSDLVIEGGQVRITIGTNAQAIGKALTTFGVSSNGEKISNEFTIQSDSTVYLTLYINQSDQNKSNSMVVSNIMVMPSNIDDTSYHPYAMSNSELTAALSPSAFQAVISTPANYVQINGGGYVRIGNLVIVQIRATWLQSCSEGAAIIQGLPKPLLNYDVYTAGASVVNNYHKNISVMGNGTIAWVDGASPSSGGLVLSAVYICKD